MQAIGPNRMGVGVCIADEDGAFEIPGMPTGVVDLRVEGRGCDPRWFHAVATDASPVTLEVHAKGERTARVRGVIVDPRGRPMVGRRFTLLRQTRTLDSREARGATTPRDGSFDLGPVPPGTYRLSLECGNYPRFLSAWHVLKPFEVWDVGEVRLEEGGRIHMTFPESPAKGLGVSVYDIDQQWLTTLTASGKSPSLRAGRHMLRIRGRASAELVREVEVVAGEVTEFAVVQRPGFACEVAVTRSASPAYETFSMEVAPSGSIGRVIKRFWFERQPVFVETVVLGEGEHVVRVVRGGVEHKQVITVTKSYDVQRFEVVLP